MIVSWMRSETATTPIGCAPFVTAFAIVIMSGVTSKLCAANACPVRPQPVITSSNTSRIPCWSQISRRRFEVPLRRHQHAGGPGDRLDEARRDVLGAVHRDDAREILGQLGAVLALARHEEILLDVRVAHVRDAREPRAVLAAVVREARQRHAAEVDAVVGAIPRHEHVAPALAARLVVGERDLHRALDRLGTGVAEEDAVEVAGRQLRNARRELELLRVGAQERRGEVELEELPADRLRDLLAAVAGRAAEQSGRRVDELLAPVVPEVHPFRADDHPRIGLEFAVGRERHPVFVERDAARVDLVAQREFGVAHGLSPEASFSCRALRRPREPGMVRSCSGKPASGRRARWGAPVRPAGAFRTFAVQQRIVNR